MNGKLIALGAYEVLENSLVVHMIAASVTDATGRVFTAPAVSIMVYPVAGLDFIGIAADEAERRNKDPQNHYPLVEWGTSCFLKGRTCKETGTLRVWEKNKRKKGRVADVHSAVRP